MSIITRLFGSGISPTDYKAGGLKISKLSKTMKKMKLPGNFIAPKKLDFRDMCLPTSDQGQTSMCAAYSSAGYIEVRNWRNNHYPEQVDPNPIYSEAKRIDGDNEDGTTLNSVAEALLNLKLIKGKAEYIDAGVDQAKFAIHQYTTMIGGFMITNDWNYAGSDGIIPSNHPGIMGGHAVLCCGYSDQGIYIQNSWSPTWGLYGFCLLSWEQFLAQFMGGVVIREV